MKQEKIFPIILISILIIFGIFLISKVKLPYQKTQISNILGFNPPLGNVNAPVKIVEFSDFQCSFCKKFHFETFKKIKDEYIEKGLVVWHYRDFAFLGNESIDASLASRCAREQNKFWEYLDILFENQIGINKGSFSKNNLLNFAKKLNLDENKFKECIDNKKYLNEIEKDIQDAQKIGARGTPYVIINNDTIEGAYPYENFKNIIEKYLKK